MKIQLFNEPKKELEETKVIGGDDEPSIQKKTPVAPPRPAPAAPVRHPAPAPAPPARPPAPAPAPPVRPPAPTPVQPPAPTPVQPPVATKTYAPPPHNLNTPIPDSRISPSGELLPPPPPPSFNTRKIESNLDDLAVDSQGGISVGGYALGAQIRAQAPVPITPVPAFVEETKQQIQEQEENEEEVENYLKSLRKKDSDSDEETKEDQENLRKARQSIVKKTKNVLSKINYYYMI